MPDVRPIRGDPEVLGFSLERLPDVRQERDEAPLGARDPVPGRGLVRHRLREEVGTGRGWQVRVGLERRHVIKGQGFILVSFIDGQEHSFHTLFREQLCQWQQPLEVTT